VDVLSVAVVVLIVTGGAVIDGVWPVVRTPPAFDVGELKLPVWVVRLLLPKKHAWSPTGQQPSGTQRCPGGQKLPSPW